MPTRSVSSTGTSIESMCAMTTEPAMRFQRSMSVADTALRTTCWQTTPTVGVSEVHLQHVVGGRRRQADTRSRGNVFGGSAGQKS